MMFADVKAQLVEFRRCDDRDVAAFVGTKEYEQVANLFIDDKKSIKTDLKYYRENWYEYRGTHYTQISEIELGKQLLDFFNNINKNQANEVKRALTKETTTHIVPKAVTEGDLKLLKLAVISRCLVSDEVEMPVWLGKQQDERSYLAMANGLVDLQALIKDGTSPIYEHTPDWFSQNCLPFPYDPQATCLTWLAFLQGTLRNPESEGLLQEWFGMCMTPDTSFQKFMLFEGVPASGKSTIANILQGMLGFENVSHLPIENFGDRFALTQTEGKLLNICSEASKVSVRIEGIIKSFVGGDMMVTDRKNQSALVFKPTARLLITTNLRPQFSDTSDGILRRMLVIKFNHPVNPENQAPNLAETILSLESSGIFNWAIEGLRKVHNQKAFTFTEVTKEALQQYRKEDTPIIDWMDSVIEEFEGGNVRTDEVFDEYCKWAERQGIKKPETRQGLARLLRQHFPSMGKEAEQIPAGEHRGKRQYVGIRWRPTEFVIH